VSAQRERATPEDAAQRLYWVEACVRCIIVAGESGNVNVGDVCAALDGVAVQLKSVENLLDEMSEAES
jgi:hypothetical protein